MPRGGARANTGPLPKLNADGTRVHAKKIARPPGEPPRSRGRPPKLNPDGTRANPPRGAPRRPAEERGVTVLEAAPLHVPPTADFSNLPFPDVGVDEMPLDMLLKVMRDKRMHPEVRMRAAQVALPFTAVKPGEVKPGKKESQQQAADNAVQGGTKFQPGRRPLAVVPREA